MNLKLMMRIIGLIGLGFVIISLMSGEQGALFWLGIILGFVGGAYLYITKFGKGGSK